jgi:hypothetical protein
MNANKTGTQVSVFPCARAGKTLKSLPKISDLPDVQPAIKTETLA